MKKGLDNRTKYAVKVAINNAVLHKFSGNKWEGLSIERCVLERRWSNRRRSHMQVAGFKHDPGDTH